MALALIFQMNLLFQNIPLTKDSQRAAIKLFFFSVPIFFFLGAIHSFIFVYFKNAHWLFLFFSIIITFGLFFLVSFFSFFAFGYLEQSQYKVIASLQAATNDIPHKKKGLLLQTFFLFIVSLVPFLNTEWKIIFSLMAYQLYSSRKHLKQVFGFSH